MTLETQFFARLDPDGSMTDGNGEEVGVAVPSHAWPGSLMVCLRVDLVKALFQAQKDGQKA